MTNSNSPLRVPFNNSFIVGKELEYVALAVERGHLAGDGEFTFKCQDWIEKRYGIRKALMTPSCTAALEMCAILIDLGPEDEVILPSYTFVSTANAFLLRGAKLRFVDIRPDTLNLDERQVEQAITSQTKVIVPVHYAGVACEIDAILAIASDRDCFVIEDAAHTTDATYRGRPLGSLGHLGAFSFHETKNFISGEGGALLINDERFIERAEIVREKGTDRSRFLRGEVDKYTWVNTGSSYLPAEMITAFLYAQFENAKAIMQKRHDIYRYYRSRLSELEANGLLRLPYVPAHCQHSAHMFYLLLEDQKQRDALILHVKKLLESDYPHPEGGALRPIHGFATAISKIL